MSSSKHGGCIVPFPTGDRTSSIETSPWALHDWRLVSREWHSVGFQSLEPPDGGWQETWYCTRCRIVDERIASGNAPRYEED
jgi:hypothetical protein